MEWLKNNKPNIDYVSGTTAASLYQSAEQLANDPNIFRKTNKFKTAIDDLRKATDATIQTERANALNDVEDIRARIQRIHPNTIATRNTSRANQGRDRTGPSGGTHAAHTVHLQNARKRTRTERTHLPATHQRTSSLRVEAEDRARRRGAGCYSYYAMDANIPESQQKETPRVAVSFATISRPHTKDALETKDDVDDFLDAYRRELIAAIENGKKILL